MKNNILKSLSFLLCFLIIINTITVITASSNGLTLNIEFSQEEYIVGETATATIYLTNAADEFEDGLVLGGIGTNLCFSDNLTYTGALDSYDTYFPIEGGDICEIVSRTVQGKNILGINIASADGVALNEIYYETVTDETKIPLVTVSFVVNDECDISVKFEEESLGDGSLAYGTDIFDGDERVVDCTIQSTTSTAEVLPGEIIIREAYATYSGDEITAYCNAFVAREEGAVMFVKLYDTTTNMIVAPVQVSSCNSGEQVFDDIGFTYTGDKDNIHIAYYIFDTETSLRPLTEFKDIPLVEYQE